MRNGNFTTLNEPSDLLSGADGEDTMLAPMQVSLAPEAITSVASIGRPNRRFMLQQAETIQLAPTALQEVIKTAIPPPEKKAPLPKPPAKALEKGSDEEEGDEAFRAGDEEEESDDSGKILGMPKAIAIGVGVAVLAIGGFLIYKKVKK